MTDLFMTNEAAMKEATLLVYRADKNALPFWRGEVIDKHSGTSICRTARVPTRNKAMLDGATHALDRGYLVVLGDVTHGKNAWRKIGTAFAPLNFAQWSMWRKFQR
jgi:hypothetical protein